MTALPIFELAFKNLHLSICATKLWTDHAEYGFLMNTRPLKFLTDLVLMSLSMPLALFLRIPDGYFIFDRIHSLMILVFFGIFYKSLIIVNFQLERRLWHKTNINDIWNTVRALVLVGLVDTVFVFYLGGLPRSLTVISTLLSAGALLGIRFLTRALFEARRVERRTGLTLKRVLIIGAGDAGSLFAREMQKHPEQGFEPVAFLDDNPRMQGQQLYGLPIAGSLEQLKEVASRYSIDTVLFSIPSAQGEVVRRVMQQVKGLELTYKAVPAVHELMSGRIEISQIRDVSVEDLLRRTPARLDLNQISNYLRGKAVLITGAGGSIGSEVVRQVLKFYPRQVILVGRGENSIFSLQQEVLRQWPEVECVALIGDVRDLERLKAIFKKYSPEVVFHAAAHKHVPLMEDSPDQAVLNNVFGTRNVAQVCLEFGVSRLVNISTDKAINPTSVMGSTKRIAEMVIAHYAQKATPGQALISVRFGNVLGSRGSVVPTFVQQIRDGGPITVTHPEMTRYFMTIPEASRLVLQAGSLGGNGQVYVLDMGQPVRIVDLARDLIQLSGAKDIDIQFSGLRPGEKLYEELFTHHEDQQRTEHPDILCARLDQVNGAWLEERLALLEQKAHLGDAHQLRLAIKELVPESEVV